MKKRKKRNNFKKALKVFSVILFTGVLALSIAFFSIFYSVKLNENNIVKAFANIKIYDNKAEEIELSINIDSYISYDEISDNIKNAFIAIEDKRYMSHHGIDVVRLIGATVNNVKAGHIREGGSTITQQLAKNTQLNSEKTYQRKIKEVKLAMDIEKNYSKEEILEMYLNAIYFGNGIYGINSACKMFFDKKPIEIEAYEAAILAGVVKNPNKNSPLRSQDNANERKNLVLRLMREQGYITEGEFDKGKNKDYIEIKSQTLDESNTPYNNSVLFEASKLLNITEKALLESNLSIYTYLDRTTQHTIYKGFVSNQFAPENVYNNKPDYSVLMLGNENGGVSGYFATHSYSVFDLRRQPGSVIKPIMVYTPALNANYISPATQYLDEQMNFDNYSPSNYQNQYTGWTDIRNAIKKSSNTVAVQLLNEIGIDYAKSTASQMGINFDENDNFLSLALGGMTQGATSMELAESYMCLANGGNHQMATFIKKIVDVNGVTIYEHKPNLNRIVSEESAYLMTDMLMDTAKSGTARKLNSLGFEIASKTGTVGSGEKSNSDAWNLSYTKDHTICTWYGNISLAKEYNFPITGGTYPTMIAKYIYQNLTEKPLPFDIPDNIVEMKIDLLALKELKKEMLASEDTPLQYQKYELYDIHNAPTEYSTLYDFPQIELDISFSYDKKAYINFETIPDYNYSLIKTNMTTGETMSIYSQQGSGELVSIYDETSNEYGIVGYTLIVQNKYGIAKESDEEYFILEDYME